MNLTPYHAKYYAFELTRRYAANSLQKFTASLSDAQVDLNPHQADAALFAFQSPLAVKTEVRALIRKRLICSIKTFQRTCTRSGTECLQAVIFHLQYVLY